MCGLSVCLTDSLVGHDGAHARPGGLLQGAGFCVDTDRLILVSSPLVDRGSGVRDANADFVEWIGCVRSEKTRDEARVAEKNIAVGNKSNAKLVWNDGSQILWIHSREEAADNG